MFVQPRQIAEVLRRHEPIGRARLVVTRQAAATRCAFAARSPASRRAWRRLAETIRALTGLRAAVELVAPGSLPNDGRMIDDRR